MICKIEAFQQIWYSHGHRAQHQNIVDSSLDRASGRNAGHHREHCLRCVSWNYSVANFSIYQQRRVWSAFISNGLDIGLTRSRDSLRDRVDLDDDLFHRGDTIQFLCIDPAGRSFRRDLRTYRLRSDELRCVAVDCTSGATRSTDDRQPNQCSAGISILYWAYDRALDEEGDPPRQGDGGRAGDAETH